MMKFATNHPRRFLKNRMWLAWTTGLFKVLVVLTVEMLNIIGLIQKCSVSQSVMGYLKYFTIASFDQFMYKSMEGAPFEEVLVKGNCMLIIDRTSSQKNSWKNESYTETLNKTGKLPAYKTMTNPEEILQEQELRRYLSFCERPCINKVLFSVYRLLKMFYISFYFYFVPMIIWSLNITIPLTYQLDVP